MIKEVGDFYKIPMFPRSLFLRDVKSKYNSKKFVNFVNIVSLYWISYAAVFHKFFVPEMIYILENIKRRRIYDELIDQLKHDTWYKDSLQYIEKKKSIPIKTDFSKISSEMSVNLTPYQKDFVLEYNKKVIFDLRGYLLAFEQGLGKTITSLALMTSLSKEKVIIICPKSTMIDVWKRHIETFYKKQKKIWFPNSKNSKCDYYIVNYESMTKLPAEAMTGDIGIIVDESHNFLTSNSNRTTNLIRLVDNTNCDDVLLMSGTPIKAFGRELAPILRILDKRFDDSCFSLFTKSFGSVDSVSGDILANRLGLLMYRKKKDEVLTLPKKTELTRKVKIPNGEEYTVSSVQDKIVKFAAERRQYYNKNKQKYIDDFNQCIRYLDNKLGNDQDWLKYKRYIKILTSMNITRIDDSVSELIRETVKYEKEVLEKILPSDLRKKFRESKTVVKYVSLRIMGEIIGGLLLKLRDNMTRDIIKYSGISDIVKNSKKKTLIFTSYVECVEYCRDYFIKNKFKPLLVYGKTTSNLKEIIKIFKEDEEANPMIASIQTLATGVTLTEANTVIFLNKPWRYVEYSQASDRVHRIGQDTEVYIYTLLLDTGNKKNLSDSMESIMNWSKELSQVIVGDDRQLKQYALQMFSR